MPALATSLTPSLFVLDLRTGRAGGNGRERNGRPPREGPGIGGGGGGPGNGGTDEGAGGRSDACVTMGGGMCAGSAGSDESADGAGRREGPDSVVVAASGGTVAGSSLPLVRTWASRGGHSAEIAVFPSGGGGMSETSTARSEWPVADG